MTRLVAHHHRRRRRVVEQVHVGLIKQRLFLAVCQRIRQRVPLLALLLLRHRLEIGGGGGQRRLQFALDHFDGCSMRRSLGQRRRATHFTDRVRVV